MISPIEFVANFVSFVMEIKTLKFNTMNIKHKIAQIKQSIEEHNEKQSVLRNLRKIEKRFDVAKNQNYNPTDLRKLIEKLAAKMEYYKSEYLPIPNAAYSLLAKYSKQYQSNLAKQNYNTLLQDRILN